MQRALKIAIILGVFLILTPITVYAVQVYVLTTPASVNVGLPTGMTMYAFHGNFPTGNCNQTQITSISYGTLSPGQSESTYVCLYDSGGTYYITNTSFSTNLPSSVGNISASYFTLQGGAQPLPQTLPIEMTPTFEIYVEYNLTISSSAAIAASNFNIVMTEYSTSTG